MIATSDLQGRLGVAVRAAHSAGGRLREGFRTGSVCDRAKSKIDDPVTTFALRADHESPHRCTGSNGHLYGDRREILSNALHRSSRR